jgi:hypothetical protein
MNSFVILIAAWLGQPAIAQQPPSPCQFAILQPRPEPALKGAEAITSRVRFLNQPDSPVAISSVDFHNSELTATATSYAWSSGERTVEIVNVSDQPVSEVRVAIRTTWPNGAGTGGTVRSSGLIPGGERAVIGGGQGRARGTNPDGGQLTVDIFIESLSVGDCAYKPSLAIPQPF